jgi:predicted nucleic acid-binding protein
MAAIGPVAIMHILDTDHLSLIRRNGPDGQRILANLDAHEDIEVATTVVTFEEQSRGRLAKNCCNCIDPECNSAHQKLYRLWTN